VSIVESLRRLVDPVEARAHEEELRVQREQPIREADGDPPTYTCRVCDHRGTEAHYCPACLADTMEPDEAKGATRGASAMTHDE
jgi:hypothetical protein